MFDVKGKRAIITGGAQGFGFQFAKRLLQEDCKVCITDIDQIKGEMAKEELQKHFGIKNDRLHFIHFDVTDKEGWNKMWDEAEKVLKGKIEILGNNAGIHPGSGWDKCLDVMCTGATRGVFTAFQRMSKKNGGNGGRIVNTASVAGLDHAAFGSIDNVGYGISKHGIVALTRYFGTFEEDTEEVHGIKCYAIAPYLADTNLIRTFFESEQKSGHPIVYQKTNINTLQDIERVLGVRSLTAEEVAESFMQSLKYDKNGAVFAVMPDLPLIDYPNEMITFMFAAAIVASKFGSILGLKMLKPAHFYSVAAILLLGLFLVLHFLLRLVL